MENLMSTLAIIQHVCKFSRSVVWTVRLSRVIKKKKMVKGWEKGEEYAENIEWLGERMADEKCNVDKWKVILVGRKAGPSFMCEIMGFEVAVITAVSA